jgi:hypothetical protein
MRKNLGALVVILYAEKKADLANHCRTTIFYGSDLVNLILASETGLFPFRHEIHHREFIPDDIQIRESDLNTMARAEVGTMDRATAKACGRVEQIFEERRLLTGHLFFLPDLAKWTLFYFDQHDTSKPRQSLAARLPSSRDNPSVAALDGRVDLEGVHLW